MSEEKPEKPRGGCLRSLVTLFTLAGVVGLGVCVWFIYQPQDLSDIKGWGPASAGQKSPDLLAVFNKSQNGVYPVTLTEEQINIYLKDRLQFNQGGFLSSFVKLNGVAVRITQERVEIILERTLFGHSFTTSMYLRVESVMDVTGRTSREVMRDGGDYFKDLPRLKRGGRLGRLEVPQGFLILVLPAFEKLATALNQEISASVGDMSRVTLSKGKVLFDPREAGEAKPLGKF